jgi:hypothetical protein
MSLMPPFTPGPTATATSGAGVSSAATALAKVNQQAMISVDTGGTNVRCFIEFGDSSVVADAVGGMALLPGERVLVTPPSAATHFAVFAATATVVYVTSGIGE